jgi:hypothetical protein
LRQPDTCEYLVEIVRPDELRNRPTTPERPYVKPQEMPVIGCFPACLVSLEFRTTGCMHHETEITKSSREMQKVRREWRRFALL